MFTRSLLVATGIVLSLPFTLSGPVDPNLLERDNPSKTCHAYTSVIRAVKTQVGGAHVERFCSSWLKETHTGASPITSLQDNQVSHACSCITASTKHAHQHTHTHSSPPTVANPTTSTPSVTSPTPSSPPATTPTNTFINDLTLPAASFAIPSGTPNPATDAPVPSDTSNAFSQKNTSQPGLGSGVATSLNGPYSLGNAPPVVLTPAAPPGIDMGGLGVLTPNLTSPLVYGGPDSTSNFTTTIALSMTYQYPSIVLDHSIYVTNVQCSGSSINGKFNNSVAFAYCSQNWPSSEVLLISTACGTNGGHGFFLSPNGITFDSSSNTFSAGGSIQNISDILHHMDVGFGTTPNISVPSPLPFDSSNATGLSLGCSSPNTTSINGLPAFPCGPDFDQQLDNYLGYYSSSNVQQTLQEFVPGTPVSSPNRRLFRRCGGFLAFICSAASYVAQKVNSAIQTVATGLATVVAAVVPGVGQQIANAIMDVAHVAEQVVNDAAALTEFVTSGDYSNGFTLPIALAPPSILLLNSPWGEPGIKFYSWTADKGGALWSAEDNAIEKLEEVTVGDPNPDPGIDIWCVNCGVNGQFSVNGEFSVSITSGFTSGSIQMSGNLLASMYIGLDAFAEWDSLEEHDFFTVGLPGFSIPDIVAVGPTLAFGVSAELDITDEGQYLIGGSLNWPDFNVNMNLLDISGSSQSGLVPQTSYNFTTDGTVRAVATFGFPVTLGFGINVLDGKWDAEAKLINTPGIRATAEYDDDVSIVNGHLSTAPQDGCYGIAWDLGFVNELDLDLSDFDGPTFNLFEWDSPPIASGCLGESKLQPSGSATPTATASPTITPSPTHSGTPTSSQKPTTAVPSGSATPTALNRMACSYGGADETALCNALWVVGDDIYINTNNMVGQGFYDNWVGTWKIMSMVFQYGTNYSNFRVLFTPENEGTLDITPYNAKTGAGIYEFFFQDVELLVPAWQNPHISILCVVWGLNVVQDQQLIYNLYGNWQINTAFQWTFDMFGSGGWPGVLYVSGSIYYLDYNRNLQVLTGNYNGWSQFPDSSYPPGWFNQKRAAEPEPVRSTHTPSTLTSSPTGAVTSIASTSTRTVNRVSTGTTSTTNTTDTTATTSSSTPTASAAASGSTSNIWAIGETTFQLNATDSGSLEMSIVNGSGSASSFEYEPSSNLVFGASGSRYFYYMPAEMTATDVSRFRVGALGEIPQGANLITMAPFSTEGSTATGEVVLLAFDTLGNYFWPAMCILQGQGSKVFLVKDPNTGATALENPDLTYTIIGGTAANCTVLALTANGLSPLGQNSTASSRLM